MREPLAGAAHCMGVNDETRQNGMEEPRIPVGIAGAMRRLEHVGEPELAGLDEIVMGAARLRLRKRSPWVLVWRAGAGMAAAAAIGFGVWMGWGRGEEKLDVARGVTMVDALRLAKLLDGKNAVSKTWDVNGDGAVDGRDVDAIARRAVKIGSAIGARDEQGGRAMARRDALGAIGGGT